VIGIPVRSVRDAVWEILVGVLCLGLVVGFGCWLVFWA